MTIECRIDRVRDTGVFYGGNKVSGTVEIKGPLPFPDYNDSKVHICFTGSSKAAHASGRRLYVDHAIFFQSKEELFVGTIDLKKGASQSWEVCFLLPETTEPEWGEAKINRKKRCEAFWMTPHPLPPSTALSSHFPQSPYPWQAYVSYTLHAKVSGEWGWREDKIILVVVPNPRRDSAPSELAVQSKEFTHSSSRLLPDEAERKRSIGKWFSDKFASNTPKAVFSIKAQTSQTLTPGQRIPIQLHLDYDTEKSNLSSFPAIRLLDMEYNIMARTELWGDEIMSTASSREFEGRPVSVYRRQLSFDTHLLVDGQTIEIHQHTGKDGTTYELVLDEALVSAFRTYNITRSYAAVVSCNFDCVGKKYKVKFSWPLAIFFNPQYIPPFQWASSNGMDNFMAAGKTGLTVAITAAVFLP